MAATTMTPKAVLALLKETGPRIAAATAGLTPVQLRTAPSAGEWSATEVLAHLRSCADVWGGHIEAILAEDHPTIRAINPRTWMKRTNYPDLEFRPSFRAFTRQRARLLAILEPLPAKAWSRKATVTGAGAVLERPLMWYAEGLATHERPHVKQIARISQPAVRPARATRA